MATDRLGIARETAGELMSEAMHRILLPHAAARSITR